MSMSSKGINPAAAGRTSVAADPAPVRSTPSTTVPPRAGGPTMNRGASQEASGFQRTSAPAKSPRTVRPQTNSYTTSTNRKDYPTAGSVIEQARMGAKAVVLTADAMRSRVSDGRSPPDFIVNRQLLRMNTMPKIAKEPFHEGRHGSLIANVDPARVFAHFTTHLREAFAAVGITMRPGPDIMPRTPEGNLRFMLEIPGKGIMPPTWFPMEARLHPETNTVELHCLEGHPFRGSNEFKFIPDREGGTIVYQVTRTQLSSRTLKLGEMMGASERQEETWKALHTYLFNSFWPAEEGTTK